MRTKIICTIGPKSESEEIIRVLIENGMSVARMNFSHGTHEEQGQKIDLVRKISLELGVPVEILCDLQGPKIRIREFDNPPIRLSENAVLALVTSSAPSIEPNEIVIEDPFLHNDVNIGDIILIDDGQIQLVAENVNDHKILTRVIVGGDLYPRKGVNLPLTKTTTSTLTEKDVKDLEFILTKDPEWVAISFVQDKEDVARVQDLIGDHRARVMCKIERARAIENLEDIITLADGVMVARGDLGIEIPIETLPLIQKRIIRTCIDAETPVVTATQMLASMTSNPFPTRAEVTDIANAVLDGTDAVMLSNETAVGSFPVEAVKMMRKVIEETERFMYHRPNKL